MVNVVIYLKEEFDAKELVHYLLNEKLIASASIDENNVLYELVDGCYTEKVFSVITSQSKSLLFSDELTPKNLLLFHSEFGLNQFRQTHNLSDWQFSKSLINH